MELAEAVKLAGDMTTNVVLLVVLWQGLKRFDKLLDLAITLAAHSQLSADDIEKLRVQVYGDKP